MSRPVERFKCIIKICFINYSLLYFVLGANKISVILREKDSIIEVLEGQITQIQDTKISLEMKCLELEERLDGFIKNEADENIISSELEQSKHQLQKYQEAIRDLSMKLSLKAPSDDSDLFKDTSEMKILQDLSSSCEEWQGQCSRLDEKLNKTLTYCNELEEKKTLLESENEKLVKDCAELRHSVDSLSNALSVKTDSSSHGTSLLNETIVQKHNEISNLNNYIKTQQTEIDNLRFSLQTTTAQMHDLSQQIEELSCTKQEVYKLNTTLDIKHKELENAASELEERSRKLSEYKKFHKLKSEDVIRISHELESVSASSQQKIFELEDALAKSQKVEEELRKEIKDLKEAVGSAPEQVDNKLQEQSLKIKKLAANVKLKTKLVKDLEIKVEELSNVIKEKDLILSSLENEKQNLLESNVSQAPQMSNIEENCKILQSKINSLNEELNSKVQELQSIKGSSSEKYETAIQTEELDNRNVKLSNVSEFNSEKMRMMEDEISNLNGLNKSLMSELEQMQETYQQDALKNVSALDVFQHEMLGNKKEIIDLSNELTDVTVKYEQAWAKLQEKDGYIEDLEQQLEKVKFRLLQIESTVEERRRSLEEKAEMLGARLCEAEKNNIQLEKHEGELEYKLSQMLNTEEMLGNILQKLQEENTENSKSLSESIDKNIHLSQELDCERNKVQSLTKEINDLQLSAANYEKVFEDYESIKIKFKESQDFYSNQVLCLEKRLAETELNMDGEIQRLMNKVGIVEAERQDAIEKMNALSIEKQTVEEDLCSLQQSIADVAKEELEQLRINHVNLTDQLNKELEKRQSYINRIEELELNLSKPTNVSENHFHLDKEIANLKCQLDNERKEKEELQYELLREKAKIEVNDVVVQAEQTYFTMSGPVYDKPEFKSLVNTSMDAVSVDVGQKGLNLQLESLEEDKSSRFEEMNDLEKRIASLASENAELKRRLQETQSHGPNSPENIGVTQESDDWAAASKDEDDGWGWGSKDALLEHEHIQKQKLNSDLESKIVELEKQLCVYQEENSRLLEELKASQIKCNKLLRKVKEFKCKNEDLERNSREKSVGFDDLDLAMQEELKSQVEKLEKNLKECNANLNALQVEREHFVKRIDILTSGNERLVEMKERQDIEVEMWQRRSNELQNKVQGLEWTLAELQAEPKSIIEKTSVSEEEKEQFISSALEMDEKLNALASENDYLQGVIVELKEKNKKNTASSYEATEYREELGLDFNKIDPTCLQLKEENDRLNSLINSLEEKIILLTKDSNINAVEYSKRIESLMKENNCLSSKIEEMKSKIGSVHVGVSTQALDLLGEKNNKECMNVVSNNEESPTLFRGFTTESNDPFDFSSTNFPNSPFDVNLQDSKLPYDKSCSVELLSSHVFESGTLSFEEQIQPHIIASSDSGVAEGNKKPNLDEYTTEVSKLKSLLCDQECESNSMKESVLRLEKENNALKEQIQNDCEQGQFKKPLVWHSLPGISSIEFSAGNTFTDNVDLVSMNNKLQEKDALINYLKEKLNLKTGSVFSEEHNQRAEAVPVTEAVPGMDDFSPVLLQSTENQNSQVNQYVNQIGQLRDTLQDKENEMRMLIDKKKKYKEMYYALAKEYDVQSLDQSTSNLNNDQLTDQNILLNQLLEDKETQLELMNQQIDQTTVAKENLQDELSLLCEIEAAKSTSASPKTKGMLLTTAQPENIEEVKTLCAEVEDLTKLLQEKDTELELLKQQFDESSLSKDNLIDELKKEIENIQIKSQSGAVGKTEEQDVERLKEVEEIEKLYKEELLLKDQQMMNLVNDLRSRENLYKDIQAKVNSLENDLKVCNFQNDNLMKELNDVNIVTNDIESDIEMSLSDKVKKLKENVAELAMKLNQAKLEIEEKDKTIQALVEKVKVLESHETEEKFDNEQQTRAKAFASEPFRISTEQSSSDDDSSSKHFETVQGQMMLMKEIQSLKQVLLLKDNEITRLSVTLNEAQETLFREELRRINSEEESLRLRLDEALYTLHLRDVRCDELALELMQVSHLFVCSMILFS